jgi:hypothetical protein
VICLRHDQEFIADRNGKYSAFGASSRRIRLAVVTFGDGGHDGLEELARLAAAGRGGRRLQIGIQAVAHPATG